ncbi:hypothetical protein JMJ77_0011309 [Colletotrichum scovillei]|uniref:Uncharacterized protein n=1 Tax=Colletotrichum scovillei TaxID=1209932 RepID=A0A9P7R527_9PEZI|nr:hypothetical protein JMJ77_0011309 [Colletotrichum scovillei]KAG7060288.1 hypothetical protein JMJ78_0015563 [Colletotrichum scovillei]KAG7067738.1 hypothetical protein JMJ76_0009166 [Colletotrichum scovillei]
MHVIDGAKGEPPTLSNRRRAAVVFLESLDLAMNLRAYHDRGRVDSGQVRITRTLQQNGSLLEIAERRCTIQKDSISSDISSGAQHIGLKEHGKIRVPEPLSSGAELPANEVKNSRVRDAEFQSLTMWKCESIAPLKALRDRQKKKSAILESPTLPTSSALDQISVRSLCEENGRLARATGAAGEACPFKSFAILHSSPCSDSRVNHFGREAAAGDVERLRARRLAAPFTTYSSPPPRLHENHTYTAVSDIWCRRYCNFVSCLGNNIGGSHIMTVNAYRAPVSMIPESLGGAAEYRAEVSVRAAMTRIVLDAARPKWCRPTHVENPNGEEHRRRESPQAKGRSVPVA